MDQVAIDTTVMTFTIILLMVVPAIALIIGTVALWRLMRTAERRRREAAVQRLLAIFGPAAVAVQQDPKQLLTWYPFAQSSRKLFPSAFAELDNGFRS